MATTISFGLSPTEINRAIKEIKTYEKQLKTRCNVFVGKLAELGMKVAKAKVGEAPLGRYVSVNVSYTPIRMGCKAVVFAIGDTVCTPNGTVNDLLLIEFGAGITYNQTANPKAGELGYGVGTFPNQTHAFDPNGWYYMDGNGDWHHSYGVKATMPMYNASTEMLVNLRKIAKECFRS